MCRAFGRKLSSACGYAAMAIITGPLLFFLSLSPSHTNILIVSALSPSMATVHTSTPAKSLLLNPSTTRPRFIHPAHHTPSFPSKPLRKLSCRATETSKVQEEEPKAGPTVSGGGNTNWVPVIPLSALPKGERRVIVQGGDVVLLLWYKDQVFAIENRSPAEGAYSEGLLNAKLTQDGCIVCPTTESTFDLRTGEIKDWYPKNPVLRILTPVLRKLYRYPVKLEGENIFIGMEGGSSTGTVPSAEIVFTGRAQIGITSSDVNVEEVRMVVDEESEGFGFSSKNESINGRAAIVGFLLLIDFELLTGKGLLKGTGFLDFIYAVSGLLS